MCIDCEQKESCWEHLKSGDVIVLDEPLHVSVALRHYPGLTIRALRIHSIAHSQKVGDFWVDTINDGQVRGRVNLIEVKFKKLSSELTEILYGQVA